jgi:hypothetical protein
MSKGKAEAIKAHIQARRETKVHYGHHTLGRTDCGLRIVKDRVWLTMNRRLITCEKCHRAQG